MISIYTIAEVAGICNVTTQSINKRIRSFTEEETQKYIVNCNTTETKKKHLSEQGLEYFRAVYRVGDNFVIDGVTEIKNFKDSKSFNEVVPALLEQLRQKDIQIAERDKQINMLMEQVRDFQVLLQAQHKCLIK